MSTIQDLIQLQNFDVNEAKPLTVRGQYSKNTNIDINKTIQSISLLTTDLNNLNSYVQQSSINIGVNFSMQQWVDNTKNTLLSQLFPSIQTLISNQKPLTKILTLTNTTVTAGLQSALNQQDLLINQLEDQVLKILEKQNNVKVEKDEDGNITLVPILTEQSKKALSNVTKILKSTITTIDKINTRISNKAPLETIDDFVNYLSINHIIEFAEKIIAILTILLQISITIRKAKDIAAATNSAALGNVAAAATYTEQSLQYTSTEQRRMDDLSSAQISISVFKSQILFYQNIIQTILDKLKDILELLKLVDNTSGVNKDITELEDKINKVIQDQQQIQNNITQTAVNFEIIRTNKPYYAAKVIK
jgi:hypothetical protein